ncbi:GbsR/MarR family transcriptional regulator [Streptomyces spectabilis]|uniref:DNA-binding transcriptional ArsR family regulator n=2 Tax=Streptomyces spectabilis TaxID=68270 RepID=A0A5P2X0X3_STRST|nr:helix-turn-helix domain-containing protein [Streptomyces spectabilis]MBB5108004.1 DNA-binding transcriptional ArsR family regulator [Streptomyces spectabilis]MCI3907894.1 helix-turn-helix domain-containing protein [Streptomyces spectabilis]QEV57354.1 MarR family transcriptional regulator [Streptomyces spectabilis]GGV53261.1 MarR family transcriptional regulator [Streptomyces spectabilis]
MPGNRLTQQDRRQIAAGLADGLSYTAIAKHLKRPTSTVTREVMRNGGPREYRADRAHHAAGRRARRDRPAGGALPQPSLPAAGSEDYGRNGQAVRAYEERLVHLLVSIGLQGMVSRVLACICVTDSGSVTSADLARRLRVSPASVSKAIGQLERQEIVRREREEGQRHDRYVIDDDVMYRAIVGNLRRNTAFAETVHEGVGVLGAATPAGARLQEMGQLLDHVSHSMIRSLEQWRALTALPAGPGSGAGGQGG